MGDCISRKAAIEKIRVAGCQGVTDASILRWRFRRKQDFEIQQRTFCCDKFERCEVYEMLEKTFEED